MFVYICHAVHGRTAFPATDFTLEWKRQGWYRCAEDSPVSLADPEAIALLRRQYAELQAQVAAKAGQEELGALKTELEGSLKEIEVIPELPAEKTGAKMYVSGDTAYVPAVGGYVPAGYSSRSAARMEFFLEVESTGQEFEIEAVSSAGTVNINFNNENIPIFEANTPTVIPAGSYEVTVDAPLSTETLRMITQEITYISPDIFQLTNLVRLTITRLPLREIPVGFSKIPNLTNLVLRQMNYTKIPGEILGVRSLKTCNFGDNLLTEIPVNFASPSTLTILQLANCQLVAVRDTITMISASLRILFLQSNPITSVDPAIGQLKNLEQVRFFFIRGNDLDAKRILLRNFLQYILDGQPWNKSCSIQVHRDMPSILGVYADPANGGTDEAAIVWQLRNTWGHTVVARGV